MAAPMGRAEHDTCPVGRLGGKDIHNLFRGIHVNGTIARVNVDRGFGFIRRPDGEPDLFFHVYSWEGQLPFGTAMTELDVEFDEGVDQRSGRARAINVRERQPQPK